MPRLRGAHDCQPHVSLALPSIEKHTCGRNRHPTYVVAAAIL